MASRQSKLKRLWNEVYTCWSTIFAEVAKVCCYLVAPLVPFVCSPKKSWTSPPVAGSWKVPPWKSSVHPPTGPWDLHLGPRRLENPWLFQSETSLKNGKKQFKSIWKSMKHLKIEGLRSSCDLPIGFEWCAVTGACTPCSCHSQASRPWHTFDSPHNCCPKIYFP